LILEGKFATHIELKPYLFSLLGFASVHLLPNPSRRLVKRFSRTINPEDAPILASAIQNSSTFLVTLDKDFLSEKVKSSLRIVGSP